MTDLDINLEKLAKLVENTVIDEKSSDGVTPYGISVLINKLLDKYGLSGKIVVNPQMMYNYAKNGRINGQKGVKRFTSAEAEVFIAKFVKTILIRNGIMQNPVKSAETVTKK